MWLKVVRRWSKVVGRFTMDSWIHDGFLDSRLIPGFTMSSWIHNGFLDSRWLPGFTIGSWIHMGSWIHNGSSILRKAGDLMPRDIMSS